MANNEPVVLVILDGFGINPRKEGNAIANASMPNFSALLRDYPTASLSMSGVDVGLPTGQMGNSEVGHMILGAGRVVYQDLTLIGKDIDEACGIDTEMATDREGFAESLPGHEHWQIDRQFHAGSRADGAAMLDAAA